MRHTQLRRTSQREIILEELRSVKTHPTADELYDMVRKRAPRVSLATVYRNLEVLAELGVIQKLELSGRQKRFDGNACPHHHIRCLGCGRVADVMPDQPDWAPVQCNFPEGFKVLGYRLEFDGLCPECARRETEPALASGVFRVVASTNQADSQDAACQSASFDDEGGGLPEGQAEILAILAAQNRSMAAKEISGATGISANAVGNRLRGLKNKGLVESPARCRYVITEAGLEQISLQDAKE